MALGRTLRNIGIAAAGPAAWIGAAAYDSKQKEKRLDRNYKNSVDELNAISAANTGAAGDAKAQMMANQGAMAAGNTAAQSASDAAKSAGLNSEAADAIGANIGNNETQNAFNPEYNKAVKANQDEISEAEKRVNEANEQRAQYGQNKSNLIKTGLRAAGTIGLGALALSDERCKRIVSSLDALSDERCKIKHKVCNSRLLNREYE